MTEQHQNPTLDFQLTLEEANIVLAALQELPAKICNPLSDKLKTQAIAQLPGQVPETKTEATDTTEAE